MLNIINQMINILQQELNIYFIKDLTNHILDYYDPYDVRNNKRKVMDEINDCFRWLEYLKHEHSER